MEVFDIVIKLLVKSYMLLSAVILTDSFKIDSSKEKFLSLIVDISRRLIQFNDTHAYTHVSASLGFLLQLSFLALTYSK